MAKTEKVSVALEKAALLAAKRLAAAEGISLSALLTRLLVAHVEQESRFDAMGVFLKEYAPRARVTDADMDALRREMNAPLKPVRRTRRKRAA